jgi:hypothetical protein
MAKSLRKIDFSGRGAKGNARVPKPPRFARLDLLGVKPKMRKNAGKTTSQEQRVIHSHGVASVAGGWALSLQQ